MDDSYQVGYRKPPLPTRWKKGCPSPNPMGRPKKSKSMTRCQFIEQRLLQEIKVTENGRTISMTYFEIILIQLMKKVAESGSQRALRILKKYERFASDKKMRNSGYVPLKVDGEDYARLLREGI